MVQPESGKVAPCAASMGCSYSDAGILNKQTRVRFSHLDMHLTRFSANVVHGAKQGWKKKQKHVDGTGQKKGNSKNTQDPMHSKRFIQQNQKHATLVFSECSTSSTHSRQEV